MRCVGGGGREKWRVYAHLGFSGQAKLANNNNNNREVTARLNKNKRPKAYVTKTTEKSSVHQKKGETQSPTARQAREGSRAVNRVQHTGAKNTAREPPKTSQPTHTKEVCTPWDKVEPPKWPHVRL